MHSDLVALLLSVLAVGTVLGGLPWLAARVRRRGIGGEVLGPFEEMWHPAAVRARQEIDVQVELRVPAPSPGDPPADPRPRRLRFSAREDHLLRHRGVMRNVR
ncbi:hypothetical protein [Saccharomonospora viridis]|uniref:hypothetical protein n=2 Tax=Saccharomonospora viridis TaxID=1852 RepID=UPI0024A8B8C5|nr:hypothetical protein [Saccharomonospora viridis]